MLFADCKKYNQPPIYFHKLDDMYTQGFPRPAQSANLNKTQ